MEICSWDMLSGLDVVKDAIAIDKTTVVGTGRHHANDPR